MQRYPRVLIAFHWLTALIICVLFALGLYMTEMAISPEKFSLYGIHKSLGICVIMVIIIRLIYRLRSSLPALPPMPKWQAFIAYLMHYMLYVLLVLAPLSGWMMSSFAGFPVSFFGLWTLPDLVTPNSHYVEFAKTIHNIIVYTLALCVVLHIMGAIKHQLESNDYIQRMLP